MMIKVLYVYVNDVQLACRTFGDLCNALGYYFGSDSPDDLLDFNMDSEGTEVIRMEWGEISEADFNELPHPEDVL